MLTRCIGDLRYKQNSKFGPDKQAVLALPNIISTEEWNTDDWILIGSSGFWEINKNQAKSTVEKMKNERF